MVVEEEGWLEMETRMQFTTEGTKGTEKPQINSWHEGSVRSYDALRGFMAIRFLGFVFIAFQSLGQSKLQRELVFVSDTQAPMWEERIFLRSNHNEEATRLIFNDISKEKPLELFILGDVVSLGYKEKKWKDIDQYIGVLRKEGTAVTALMGNHDVMTRAEKGRINFEKRFPLHLKTGYYVIVDSIAVVLMNSNISKLSAVEVMQQKSWLESTLKMLDQNQSVQTVIVTCHHSPYTNSKIVGPSKDAQQYFVPAFRQSVKGRLFISGHSHNYEHFQKEGKDFLVIGGGGGLHQPLKPSTHDLMDIASDYKPMFHYLKVTRGKNELVVSSTYLKADFSAFEKGISFTVPFH